MLNMELTEKQLQQIIIKLALKHFFQFLRALKQILIPYSVIIYPDPGSGYISIAPMQTTAFLLIFFGQFQVGLGDMWSFE